MSRRTKPSTLAGNAGKHLSYREAWGRIKGSIAHGYYLEAITLEESIISDRLSSYLVRAGKASPDAKLERESFASLIQRWRNCAPSTIADAFFPDLHSAVDEWRGRRNKLVHGIVKSLPGQSPPSVPDFRAEAESAARDGERVAKCVCNWYSREKTKLKRGGSKTVVEPVR